MFERQAREADAPFHYNQPWVEWNQPLAVREVGGMSGAAEAPKTVVMERTQRLLADRAHVARSWRERMVGLLSRESLPPGEALIFPGCHSIHTVGMRFAIDVIFVNRQWRVVAVQAAVAPGRLLLPVWNAWGVIEMAAGTMDRVELRVGDQLQVVASGSVAQ